MKIAILNLDDTVVIPAGKQLGEDHFVDLRDSVFRAVDGWDIRETLPGTFSLSAPWMPHSVTVGGYGYSYVRETIEPVDTESPDVETTREQLAIVVPQQHGKRGRR